ncbi:MAG: penicillin acylase family protein [Acetobacteraceae bacterium]
MRWLRRALFAVVSLLAAAAAAVAGALWWTLPPQTLRAHIPGLAAPVHITLDADGIPRIRAASDTDAAAALGFMHARDRMFEMELMRRAASGRLSELAGPLTLRLDRSNRALGLRARAEADLPGLDPATRALLDAYASGVNAWIARRGRFAAPEFLLLGAPEPWTPVDSLLWGKTMALYLSGNWRAKIAHASLAARLPPDIQRALWPDRADTPRPDAALIPPTRLAHLVPDFPDPFTLPATASNEWAVDATHSTTGAPILAGDPHLAFGMPGIWYLARIDTPGHVLAGATAPGVPFLIIGHNGHLAWTFTTTGADTQDVFIETPLSATTYATPDGPCPFTIRTERIAVRGQPDDVLDIRETRHGPVFSDLDPTPGGPVAAIAMASLAPNDTAADGLAALNRAETVEQAGRAAALIVAPVQNLLAADHDRIAQFTTGRIPLRRAGDGTVPVSGADGAHDWTGFATGTQLPHQIAPASGRLVNANERVAGPDFPVFMGQDWFGDWRARRIRTLLEARDRHDPAGFAAMQVDPVSAFAQQVLPTLLATQPADDPSRRALAALRVWDGAMRMEQPQPLLFNAWVRHIAAAVIERSGIGDAQTGPAADLVGQALTPSGRPLCGGDCAPLLAQTLAATTAELAATHGPAWDAIPWGRVHQAVFAHPLLGRLPLLGEHVTWRIPQPGDDTTVFRGSARPPGWAPGWSLRWDSIHGPGYRGVYDLANLDRSLFGMTPGQSGNPLLATASSLLQRWRDGTPLRLGPTPDTIADTVGLQP